MSVWPVSLPMSCSWWHIHLHFSSLKCAKKCKRNGGSEIIKKLNKSESIKERLLRSLFDIIGQPDLYRVPSLPDTSNIRKWWPSGFVGQPESVWCWHFIYSPFTWSLADVISCVSQWLVVTGDPMMINTSHSIIHWVPSGSVPCVIYRVVVDWRLPTNCLIPSSQSTNLLMVGEVGLQVASPPGSHWNFV